MALLKFQNIQWGAHHIYLTLSNEIACNLEKLKALTSRIPQPKSLSFIINSKGEKGAREMIQSEY